MDQSLINKLTPDVIAHHAESFCSLFGAHCATGSTSWDSLTEAATAIIAQSWGSDNPSPFKQVAAVVLAIRFCAPVSDLLPSANQLPKEFGCMAPLRNFPGIFPSMLGHSFAVYALWGAKVGNDSAHGGRKHLTEKLVLSAHSYMDHLATLALIKGDRTENNIVSIPNIASLFNAVSTFYEMCAYTSNSEARYPGAATFSTI